MSRVRTLLAIVGGILVMSAIALSAACTFVLHRYEVPSSSMTPTLGRGDSFWTVRFGSVHRGDVVVITPPPAARPPRAEHIVTREVAVGGDVVEASGGELIVNGAPAFEPYLAPGTKTRDIQRTVVPEGTVYVLGDNRANTQGSWTYGPVPLRNVTDRFVRKNPPPTIIVYVLTAVLVIAFVTFMERHHRSRSAD